METGNIILIKVAPERTTDFVKTEHYYREYLGSLSNKKHSKVINTFFDKIALHLLKGNSFRSPIGKIWIKRVRLDPYKKYVNLGATKEARKTDKSVTVYYTKNYFFAFGWRKPVSKPYEEYVFDASYKNTRKIPQYESILELHAL